MNQWQCSQYSKNPSAEEMLKKIRENLKQSQENANDENVTSAEKLMNDFPHLNKANFENPFHQKSQKSKGSFQFKKSTTNKVGTSAKKHKKDISNTPLRQSQVTPSSSQAPKQNKFSVNQVLNSEILNPRSFSPKMLKYTLSTKVKHIPSSSRTLTGLGLLPIITLVSMTPFVRGYASLFLSLGLDYSSLILAVSSAFAIGSLTSDMKLLEEKLGPDGDMPGHQENDKSILRMTSKNDAHKLFVLPRTITTIAGISIAFFSLYLDPIPTIFLTACGLLSLSFSDYRFTKLGLYPRWFFICRLIFFLSVIFGNILLFAMYNVYISLEALDNPEDDKNNFLDTRKRMILSASDVRHLHEEAKRVDEDDETL